MTSPNIPEPPPKPNDSRPVWEMVIEDMHERNQEGIRKYGTPLQAHNGRKPLVDAYQEVLDLAVYLRQAIEELPPVRPVKAWTQEEGGKWEGVMRCGSQEWTIELGRPSKVHITFPHAHEARFWDENYCLLGVIHVEVRDG